MTNTLSHLSLLRSCSALSCLNKVVFPPTKCGCFLLAFGGSPWLRSAGVEGLGEEAEARPGGAASWRGQVVICARSTDYRVLPTEMS